MNIKQIIKRLADMGPFKPCKLAGFRILDALYVMRHGRPIILSLTETVNAIREKQLSVARFGDGEISIMCGNGIPFQSYNERLAKKLRECIRSQEVLVCIPGVFRGLSGYNEQTRRFWTCQMYYERGLWYSYIDMNKKYGDAFISRFYNPYRNKGHVAEFVALLKSIWKNRDVVIIEGVMSRVGVGNDLFSQARSVRRILAPIRNAFDKYDEIISKAKKMDVDALFILALGPTATVMALDLALLGYQALDLGHIDLEYEWSLRGTMEKVAVPGKFCNESFREGLSRAEVEGELAESDYCRYRAEIVSDLSS